MYVYHPEKFHVFFLASVTFLRSGRKTGTTDAQNSMANVEPCLNGRPRGWLWGEKALMATRPPVCRAPVAPRSVHGLCWPTRPASRLGTSWAQLCPFLWACCPLGLQIWPYGRPWASEDIPREPEFSPASLNVAQIVVTNSYPFVCQILSSVFFIIKSPLNFIFISLVKESSICSGELASGLHPHNLQPHWSLCYVCRAWSHAGLWAQDAVCFLFVLREILEILEGQSLLYRSWTVGLRVEMLAVRSEITFWAWAVAWEPTVHRLLGWVWRVPHHFSCTSG